MRVAVAGIDDQVAPRLDQSTYVLLVTIEDHAVRDAAVRSVRRVPPTRLPGFLAARGVQRLVCGGILREQQDGLENADIQVTWGVIGSTTATVCALAHGTLRCDQFVPPEAATERGRLICDPLLRRVVRRTTTQPACSPASRTPAPGQETVA